MNQIRLSILAVLVMLVACHSMNNKGIIAKLRHMQVEIKGEKIEGGLEKEMLSYQGFLEETTDPVLTPEAIRRLADLKIEKEYGTLTEDALPAGRVTTPTMSIQEDAAHPKSSSVNGGKSQQAREHISVHKHSMISQTSSINGPLPTPAS